MAAKNAPKKDQTANETDVKDSGKEKSSSIVYANDVIATIAGTAAAEVEGIAEMCNVPSGSLLSRKPSVTKGVKVEIGTEEVAVDLYIIVEYGTPIQKCATDAQEGVRRAIESMTGLRVVRVDVHVQGVSFEKEKNALQAGSKTAVLTDGSDAESKGRKAKAKKADAAEADEEPVKETVMEEAAKADAVQESAVEAAEVETEDREAAAGAAAQE